MDSRLTPRPDRRLGAARSTASRAGTGALSKAKILALIPPSAGGAYVTTPFVVMYALL